MVRIPDVRGLFQRTFQQSLSLNQRLISKVFSIEHQQVERPLLSRSCNGKSPYFQRDEVRLRPSLFLTADLARKGWTVGFSGHNKPDQPYFDDDIETLAPVDRDETRTDTMRRHLLPNCKRRVDTVEISKTFP